MSEEPVEPIETMNSEQAKSPAKLAQAIINILNEEKAPLDVAVNALIMATASVLQPVVGHGETNKACQQFGKQLKVSLNMLRGIREEEAKDQSVH